MMYTLAMPMVEYYQDSTFYYMVSDNHRLIQVAKSGKFHYEWETIGTGKLDMIIGLRRRKDIYRPAEASICEPLFKKYL